ncbi:MAG: hypothetical protein GQ570_00355 [Helicobacteraceae bacterium]|nr:hypothetical protein [Helicobacteraceae bacterium]
MFVEDVNLIYVNDPEVEDTGDEKEPEATTKAVEFLLKQAKEFYEFDDLIIDHELSTEVHLIVLRKYKSRVDIRNFLKDLKAYNSFVRVIHIASRAINNNNEKIFKGLVDVYVDLPIVIPQFKIAVEQQSALSLGKTYVVEEVNVDFEEEEIDIVTKIPYFSYLKKFLHGTSSEFCFCNLRIMNRYDLVNENGESFYIDRAREFYELLVKKFVNKKVAMWDDENFIFLIPETFEKAIEFTSELTNGMTYNAQINLLCATIECQTRQGIDENLIYIQQMIDTTTNSNANIYVTYSHDNIKDEGERVAMILRDLLALRGAKAHLNVHSFYKGLAIATNGVNLYMQEDNSLVFETDRVQCVAMKYEKSIILQSSYLPADTQCSVVSANPKTKTVVVNNFKLLDYSPIGRKGIRVVPRSNMSASLTARTFSMSGIVQDISDDSLSILVSNEVAAKLDNGTTVKVSTILANYIENTSQTVYVGGTIVKVEKIKTKFMVAVSLQRDNAKATKALKMYIKSRTLELKAELKKALRVKLSD